MKNKILKANPFGQRPVIARTLSPVVARIWLETGLAWLLLVMGAFSMSRANATVELGPVSVADPSLRSRVPARWWESAAAIKVVTLKRGLHWASEEISLDAGKASEQLDRIKAEGFQAIEIFAPAEGLRAYSGLDTKNHYRIDPDLGTMDDFRRLIRQVHARGLAVIIFHNIGYFSVESPDWLERCDLKKAGQTDGKVKWFLWADQPDAPPPFPANGVFEGGGNPATRPKTWGWQYSERAGCYYWSRWEARLENGTRVGLPQNNWGATEWPREAARILRTWMDCGLDGMLIDAPMCYPGLTWEKNNQYITGVIRKYGNTLVQPEGGRGLSWITEGNYNCLQDYGLSAIDTAVESGDPRPIEESLRFHDSVVKQGAILYKVTNHTNLDAAKRHLVRATVAAVGDMAACIQVRGAAQSGPDAEEARILKTKFEHPALHNLGLRQKLSTKHDSKHYAILRTAAESRSLHLGTNGTSSATAFRQVSRRFFPSGLPRHRMTGN